MRVAQERACGVPGDSRGDPRECRRHLQGMLLGLEVYPHGSHLPRSSRKMEKSFCCASHWSMVSREEIGRKNDVETHAG